MPELVNKEQQKEIYYIKLNQPYDWNTIASRYNGNIKEIVTQSELQANELR
jgi:hypothetical protein